MPWGVAAAAGIGLIGNAISGGSNPGVTQEPSTNTTTSGQQSSLASLLSLLGGGSAGTGGTSTSPAYTGQLTAGLTGDQQNTLGNISSSLASLLSPSSGLNQGISAAEGVANATPANFSSYFNNSVVQPLMQSFNTQTIPALQSAFGASAGGTQSSQYAQAVDTATNNLENTIASDASSTALTQYNNQQTNALSAAGVLNNSANTALSAEEGALSAQGVEQTTNQTADSNAYQEFLNQLSQNNTVNSQLLSASTAQTVQQGNTVATSGTNGLGTSLLQGLSSNGGSGITSLGNSISSSSLVKYLSSLL
jgi:hypothetical protein